MPDKFTIQDIEVNFDEKGMYSGELTIEAIDRKKAIEEAIFRIEELLFLLAIHGDGFRISLGMGLSAKEIAAQSPEEIIDDGSGNIQLRISETFYISDFVEVCSVRKAFPFESVSISHRASWPHWLRTALRLNYLSVISYELETTLITLYSALEVIVSGVLPSSTTVFKNKFSSDLKKEQDIIEQLKSLFSKYEFSPEESERLINHVRTTERESKNLRIQKVLKEYNGPADFENIKSVTGARGKIVHTGNVSDNKQLEKAVAELRIWVNAILKKYLENCD
ncbi:MAG: hypothetical protein KAR20_00750 [Candidatus Heimdallarchaeota archaeon]|nr:hypothetical protein [Candidatus Heimdallarchaeota archaeon]